MKRIFTTIAAVLIMISTSYAQRTEVTVTLSEQFFDAVLDAINQNGGLPEFAIAANVGRSAPVNEGDRDGAGAGAFAFVNASATTRIAECRQTVRLLRETNGVRTAVRFREGKIYAPLAFVGNYAPPFVGCVAFSGFAETNIDLEFDQQNQRLIGRATVHSVSLNGTGGIGSSVIAKMIQSSIDKKVNPITILSTDRLSFPIPVPNGSPLKMKAVGIRHEIVNGQLNIHVAYEFTK